MEECEVDTNLITIKKLCLTGFEVFSPDGCIDKQIFDMDRRPVIE